jgi:hypothetical protein
MKRLYKNWFIHNTISHPLSEILYWMTFRNERVSNWIHDVTLPEHERGDLNDT